MQAVYKENIHKENLINTKHIFSCLSLIVPFQPTMQDEDEINAILNNTLQTVHQTLEKRQGSEPANNLLYRLKKIFDKLNFNTHRKSLAIILAPDTEKVIYLNFHAKPVAICNKPTSLIDLVGSIQSEPDFYLLLVKENLTLLYDHHNGQLSKVYERGKQSGVGNNDAVTPCSNVVMPSTISPAYRQVFNIIKLMNSKHEKPVFVTGNSQHVDLFYQTYAAYESIFKIKSPATCCDGDLMKFLSKDIATAWDSLYAKIFAGRINLLQRTNHFVYTMEAVIQALCESKDGVLVIDERLNMQLFKSYFITTLTNFQEELMKQIEKFLQRGNRIEIIKSGLLKDFGNIVLLGNKASADVKQISFY